MTSRLRLFLTAAVLLLTPASLAAQSAAPCAHSSWLAEFPPYDVAVTYQLQRGFASKSADRLLRKNPLGIETVQALVSASREEEALRARDRSSTGTPSELRNCSLGSRSSFHR